MADPNMNWSEFLRNRGTLGSYLLARGLEGAGVIEPPQAAGPGADMSVLRRLAAQQELAQLQQQTGGLPNTVSDTNNLAVTLPTGPRVEYGAPERMQEAATLARMGVSPDQWQRSEGLRQQQEMRQQALQGINDPVMLANFANQRTVAPRYSAGAAGVLDQYGGGMQWSPAHMAGAGLDQERTVTEGFRQGELTSQGRANEALAAQRRRATVQINEGGKRRRALVDMSPDGTWTDTGLEPDASPQREHKQTDSPLGMYQWAFKNALDKSFRPSDPAEIEKAQSAALAVVRAQYPGWSPEQGAPQPAGAAGVQAGAGPSDQFVDTPMGRYRIIGYAPDGEPLVVPAP